MPKHLRSIVASLFFGSLVLLSCSDKNPTTSVSNNNQNEMGQAIVHLPDLSSHQLQKLPAGVTDSNALTLLIVAADMDTMKYSWSVASLKGQQVVIEGIPAGKNRLFEGFLTARGNVTHSGKVAVQILAGQQVPVNLKLTGTGSADVCIEIEGYPSSCNQNDSFSVVTCLYVSTPRSQMTGTCKLFVNGTYASGAFTFFGTKPDTTIFYNINGPIEVQSSSGYRTCRTIVQERTTKINYWANFTINNDSIIYSGYISKDSIPYSIIAKFYSVKCSNPDTTISVSSCLDGYTPTNKLFGKISMTSNGKSVSGSFTLNNMEDSSTFGIYYFEKLVQQQGSVCQSIVVNKLTGTRHFLNMTIVNSKITYSYLSRDTLLQSEAIAKFFSVECSTPPPTDTTYIKVPFNGTGTYPDTFKFSATMAIKVSNGKAIGDFYFYNCPLIKPNLISVSGIYQKLSDSTSGYMSLTSTDTSACYYAIVSKFSKGYYSGYVTQKGTCGTKSIGDIESPKGSY
jgi:hypothetical protein